MIGYFIFNGKDSRDYGCYLETMPVRTRAPREFVEYDIPGADGSIIKEYGYKSYDKQLSIGIKDANILDQIMGWLDGSGKIIFGDELDKYYNVSFLNQIDYQKALRFRKATITARFQPYKYAVSDTTYTGNTVVNKGNTNARPVLTISGKGSCSVSVNGIHICDVTELPITIDSLKMESYTGTTNRNRKKIGDYIIIPPGQSTITITGDNVSGFSVKGCSRWL